MVVGESIVLVITNQRTDKKYDIGIFKHKCIRFCSTKIDISYQNFEEISSCSVCFLRNKYNRFE